MAVTRTKRTATRARSTLRRKSLILDQAKIARAKRNLRAATETDTIHRALDAVNDLASFRRAVGAGSGRAARGRGLCRLCPGHGGIAVGGCSSSTRTSIASFNATIITRNGAGFDLIQRVSDSRYVPPWPVAASA
jgi:hypothetical protein